MPTIVATTRIAVAACIPTLFATAQASAQSITNLGTLLGAESSYAYGVSADGLVVTGNCDSRPFRWNATTGMQLLPVLGQTLSATGHALSADGSVIVGGGDGRAMRWTSTGVSDLGSTGASGSAFAAAVSADGETVVGFSGTSSFVWQQVSGMQQIAPDSIARAISADGSTIGGYLYSTSDGFRWQPPGAIETVIPDGGVEDLSVDGSVLVGWIETELGQRAYRWSEAPGVQLLPLLPGASSAYAAAVSGDGLTVAGACNVDSVDHAFVWSESAGTVSLRELLQSLGVDLSGWTVLASIRSMSADGRVVVGYGTFEGSTRAFIADITETCPGDVTNGGAVDATDLSVILAAWGTNGQGEFDADADNSGLVDGGDLALVLSGWGPCPR